MMWLALRTLRFRWPVFVGTFLALTFGVALMATTLLCIAGGQTPTNATDEWLKAVATTLLGNAAGVSGAAAILVVSGTFSFAVVQRRREFALLRAIGATPRQVQRLILGESLFVGIAAAIAGCLLSLAVAPVFAGWMASVELAPPNFRPEVAWWPLVIAAAVGVMSALFSSKIASRRASRVRPVEALMDAVMEQRTMTPVRWVAAGIFVLGAVLMVPVVTGSTSEISAAYIILEILLLLFAVVMLLPAMTALCARAASTILRGTIANLSVANIRTNLRRSSSVVAPIFITMGLAAAAFSSIATLAEARNQAAKDRLIAPLVVSADQGLDNAALEAIRSASQGAAVEQVTQTSVLRAKDSVRNSDEIPAMYVRPSISAVMRMPLLEGNLAGLSASDIAVSEKTAAANGWKLGESVTLWTTAGAKISAEVGAIVRDSQDLGSIVLLPEALRQQVEPTLNVSQVYITPDADTSSDGLRTILEPLVRRYGAEVLVSGELLATQAEKDARIDRVALMTVVGLAILYTALSIANTCIMAVAGRFRDFAVLQLSGATRKQIVRMVVFETSVIVAIAFVAAVLVTVAALAVTAATGAGAQLTLPYLQVVPVLVACAVVALATSLITTVWAFRVPAIRIAASRE